MQPKARSEKGTAGAQQANPMDSLSEFAAQIDSTDGAKRDAAQALNDVSANGCRSMPREAERQYFSPIVDRIQRQSASGDMHRLSAFSPEPKIPLPFTGAK